MPKPAPPSQRKGPGGEAAAGPPVRCPAPRGCLGRAHASPPPPLCLPSLPVSSSPRPGSRLSASFCLHLRRCPLSSRPPPAPERPTSTSSTRSGAQGASGWRPTGFGATLSPQTWAQKLPCGSISCPSNILGGRGPRNTAKVCWVCLRSCGGLKELAFPLSFFFFFTFFSFFSFF